MCGRALGRGPESGPGRAAEPDGIAATGAYSVAVHGAGQIAVGIVQGCAEQVPSDAVVGSEHACGIVVALRSSGRNPVVERIIEVERRHVAGGIVGQAEGLRDQRAVVPARRVVVAGRRSAQRFVLAEVETLVGCGVGGHLHRPALVVCHVGGVPGVGVVGDVPQVRVESRKRQAGDGRQIPGIVMWVLESRKMPCLTTVVVVTPVVGLVVVVKPRA